MGEDDEYLESVVGNLKVIELRRDPRGIYQSAKMNHTLTRAIRSLVPSNVGLGNQERVGILQMDADPITYIELLCRIYVEVASTQRDNVFRVSLEELVDSNRTRAHEMFKFLGV